MQSLLRLTLCVSIPLLASCQTEPQPSRSLITATDSAIWKEALCATGKPILISRADVLTVATAEQIGDHNNALWCACERIRPPTFDDGVCRV